jgi:hypothetical protein
MDVTDVSQKEQIETFSEMRVQNKETAVANGTHCPEQVSLLGLRPKIYLLDLYRMEIRRALLSAVGCLRDEYSEGSRKAGVVHRDMSGELVLQLPAWKPAILTDVSVFFLGISSKFLDGTHFDSSQIMPLFCYGLACNGL